jgi:Ni,Fe-hydrogenase maturation factor
VVGRVDVVGEVTPEGVGGFLAVVDVVDVGLGLGELVVVEPDRVEVRRAAVTSVEGLRFSSSDTEG